MKVLLVALIFTGSIFAQGHSVTLTYTDGVNGVGTNYVMYRASITCPGTTQATATMPPAGFQSLGNSSALTMVDTTVTAGTTYCYIVSAVAPGLGESNVGNPMVTITVPTNGVVTSNPVSNLKAVAK